MYQTRAKVSKKIPIHRKGTKYVARASSHIQDSVPVVVAIRDMLGLARTAREVKQMINRKQLKINGKEVKDHKESIKLFNILEADKAYTLTLTPTKRFSFKATKEKTRLVKVTGKKMLKKKEIQLNFHDGSNVITKDKINVQDSVYLDKSGKVAKHVQMEKGKTCFILSGKYMGFEGKIEKLEDGKASVSLKEIEDKKTLDKGSLIVL